MHRFLLVSPRHGADIARAEYRDFITATGLPAAALDQVLLDSANASLPPLDAYSGVFVGGSPFMMSDAEYSAEQTHILSLLETLVDGPIPTFFVCFGHGFLNAYAGGKIGRTHPEDAGPTTVELTASGRKDPLTAGIPAEFTSLTGHTENVVIPGFECEVLATAISCPVQMVRYGAHTWSCQFHADMDPAAMKARMDFYMDYGYFDKKEYATIVAGLPSVDTTYSNKLLANFVEYCRSR